MQISYTKSAQHALKYAARAAREMKHPYIGTEHLLLALREEYTGVACLLYTSPSPRDAHESRMPSSA